MARSVIFLAFANDQDDYLPLINRERKNIKRTLRMHDEKGTLKLVSEASSTIEDVFEFFREYHNQIVIFHFGGHAGGTKLFMEDDDGSSVSVNGEGLARLLGKQENLKLVFLNGCATKAQVELLFKHGIPAVIATSVPVKDKMATEFAEQFYNALARHTNIKWAFEIAQAFMEAKYQEVHKIGIHRAKIAFGTSLPEGLPWGLYLNSEEEGTLDWSIPRVSIQKQTLRNRFDYETQADVNDILIDTLCGEVAKYSKGLEFELEREDFDIPSIKREIVDAFPTPIGEQLRKLFTRSNDPKIPDEMELYTLARLKQITQTFRVTSQFLCYIMLSQLWDVKFEDKETSFEIGEDFIVTFNSFFSLNQSNFQFFDFVQLIRTIVLLFDKYKIPYFIEELEQVKTKIKEDKELNDAYFFLNNIYENLLVGRVDEQGQELASLCQEAEFHLGVALSDVAFLAKYKLATIKAIELIKNRHEPPRFRHTQIVLNQALTVASTGVTEVGIEFENYSDSKCVLFLKTKDDQIKDYLNLTPFIIDENALNNDYSTKLFLYAFEDGEDYCFLFLNNLADPPLRINEGLHPGIKQQFDRFKAEIFGLPYQSGSTPKTGRAKGRFLSKKNKNSAS